MSEQGYEALRALVNSARFQQVRCLSTLKRLMVQQGFEQEHIDEAISQWRSYEDSKKYGSGGTEDCSIDA